MIELFIIAPDGTTIAGHAAETELALVHRAPYAEGTRLGVTAPRGSTLMLSLDQGLAPSLVHLPDGGFEMPVPFSRATEGYAPTAFTGELHRLMARLARPEELATRRDLALNPHDHADSTGFPHADATVITRGEAGFAARCAIDGEVANEDHGRWPWTSWGIAQDPDAALTIRFGRLVQIDEIALTLRADFPHDSWWDRATVTFGDPAGGDSVELSLIKTDARQPFEVTPREVEEITLDRLRRADLDSPFPALTRIEVMGTWTETDA
ncbi:carbohydrate-binding protein [Pelagovum pacificum]|uniref:Carbohydrate-binding protein n=1 Tax=Pelagovum pacificum TaxID=2588711 RepID=A0A5C5GHX8_9RHOB|nr:carbohydrate-binding protein [Pelagovum pacificum]QQA43381.1 hypothetical protein I8N54_02065 [Pelagovum pacificum]TNY33481.1 carbohydrate-binding protein [Pelagovum pacificum]